MSHASPPQALADPLTDPLVGCETDDAIRFANENAEFTAPDAPPDAPSGTGSVVPSMLGASGDGDTRSEARPAAGSAGLRSTVKTLAADEADAFSRRLPAAKTAAPGAPRWLGKRVGRFKLVSLLGRGSWGKVFEAEDTALKRRVALKLLATTRTGGGKPVDLPRLLSEARAAAALDHPHATQIYEVGQSKDLFYIAMELAEGGSLDDVLNAGGPLDPIRACRLAAEAADALSLAHELGITHRDVKPGNLLLSRSGRCKVADFGLATIDDPADPCHFTRFAGTAYYVAPEIVRGERADARSDVYSLGATLFHLLTGNKPFEGSRSTVLRAHLQTAAPDLRELQPDLDPRLAAVIRKAMSKDAADRFESAAAMSRALRLFTVPVSDTGVKQAAPSTSSSSLSSLSLARRHAKPLVAIAAVAAVGLAIVLAASLGGPDAASASPEASAERTAHQQSPPPPGQPSAPVIPPVPEGAVLVPHRFSLDAREWKQKPASVHLSGDFNGWSPDLNPMTDPDNDGIWTSDVELVVGDHEYKFVIDGSRWMTDPAADASLEVDDGHGGHNSVRPVTASAPQD